MKPYPQKVWSLARFIADCLGVQQGKHVTPKQVIEEELKTIAIKETN